MWALRAALIGRSSVFGYRGLADDASRPAQEGEPATQSSRATDGDTGGATEGGPEASAEALGPELQHSGPEALRARLPMKPGRRPTRKMKGSYVDNEDFKDELDAMSATLPADMPIYDLREVLPYLSDPQSSQTELMALIADQSPELLDVISPPAPVAPRPGAQPILRWTSKLVLTVGPMAEDHPANKKVQCRVYLRDLQRETGLTDDALEYIARICLSRYNPHKGELTLCDPSRVASNRLGPQQLRPEQSNSADPAHRRRMTENHQEAQPQAKTFKDETVKDVNFPPSLQRLPLQDRNGRELLDLEAAEPAECNTRPLLELAPGAAAQLVDNRDQVRCAIALDIEAGCCFEAKASSPEGPFHSSLHYGVLLAACIAVSSLGIGMDMQAAGPFLKCAWRSQATVLILLPGLAFVVWRDPSHLHPLRDRHLLGWLLVASAGQTLFIGLFVWALTYTSIMHAFLLNNTHSIMIVIGSALIGKHVSWLEGAGAVTGFAGTLLCGVDASRQTSGAALPSEARSHQQSLQPIGISPLAGDLAALIGAAFGALSILAIKICRVRLHVLLLTVLVYVASLPLFLMLACLADPHAPTWGRNPATGLLGWVTGEQIGAEVIVALVATIGGSMGYMVVLRHLDGLVISVTMLVEPLIANMLGVALGLDSWPSGITLLGGSVVIGATLLVITGSRRRSLVVCQTPKGQLNSCRGPPLKAVGMLGDSPCQTDRATTYSHNKQAKELQPPTVGGLTSN
ncbi:hypothetical protein WJX72_001179 [[Myrmecia] bisecta]|uniref:EamA domain-containing protein n=1 Tax=[Myrmecia] bisecta TaxID=41462 RepID=A0AAW1R4R9_9CHLO